MKHYLVLNSPNILKIVSFVSLSQFDVFLSPSLSFSVSLSLSPCLFIPLCLSFFCVFVLFSSYYLNLSLSQSTSLSLFFVCLSPCVPVSLSHFLSLSLSLCISVSLTFYRSVSLSVSYCLSVAMFSSVFICQSHSLSISFSLFVCPAISNDTFLLFICLSIFLFLFVPSLPRSISLSNV